MKALQYTGQVPLHIVGVGNVEPGETLTVSDEAAENLLLRPDFTKKKATRPRKATTNQEVCADNRS